ncbi:MAG: hypothetical protein WKF47_09655 [Geodermatophilaceae bacterium]
MHSGLPDVRRALRYRAGLGTAPPPDLPFRRVGHRCEACGAAEDRTTPRRLEAHERWHYDDRTGVQALRRLIALCSPCHLVTHFGYANVTGRTDEAFAHLRAVTGMTQLQAWAHIRAAEDLWIERSARVWELDLSIFTGTGITLARPERAADRPVAAERALRHEQAPIPSPRRPPSVEPKPPPPAASRAVESSSAVLWFLGPHHGQMDRNAEGRRPWLLRGLKCRRTQCRGEHGGRV